MTIHTPHERNSGGMSESLTFNFDLYGVAELSLMFFDNVYLVKKPINLTLGVKVQGRIWIMNVRDTLSHGDTPMCQIW